MGRGKSFKHKTKGHDRELPESGEQVQSKNTEHVEYVIEPVATADQPAVSVQVTKDSDLEENPYS
ncbi:hypothetical protein JOC85_002069 [Bacillus mesophilus]|uniref:Uncharacterized protein n=1 Tax=Bacillus mesophilus TaxID=1808955 RepID=A0A6M0Q4C5_9BACI|nr:hypothetical protein [Bacillus mesophilus]MBM7661297.1 hypothetical protein [Bacillus mesophilus]NEY71181.1 hypothetical protein [Bacillus mesophilus]